MELAQATARVRHIIRETLVNECGSPVVANMMNGILEQQINESIRRLRDEFKRAKERGTEHIIWPRMVMRYAPDEEGNEVFPVWGPVKDEEGRTLGVKVYSQTQGGIPRKPRAHLHWFPPVLE